MVTKSQAFPSRFWKADDLPEGGKVFKIESLDVEEVGTDKKSKYVLHFVKQDKGLVLNPTNWDLIAAFLGADSDNWTGGLIVLYPTETAFGGKTVPCIRVRRPREEAPSKPKPGTEQRASKPTPDDDTADEIPF
jgi:hypothetical protein